MSDNDTIKSPVSPNNIPNEIKDNKVKLAWNDQTETLLSSWSDISSCYNWMHDKSFRKYQKKNFKFSLPVIILSTLTGTLNLALQGYVPPEYITYAQAGIGGVNIFTGILTTLQNYFRYAENSESHRNASVGWGKLQRNISIELTYDRLSRKDADSFIKVCRMEYDRLLEQSPIIPTEIIRLFKEKYAEQRKQQKKQRKQKRKNSKTIEDDIEEDDNDDKLILPDVCGELTHTGVYKESLNECTRLDTMLDVKYSEESKLIPEIKDVLLDRLSILEEKLNASHTPTMEYKPLHEYSLEELQLALNKKGISNKITDNNNTEKYINQTIQKNIEPLNLHIRRLSEQLQKPDLNRVNTSYMANIPIKSNNRDYSFKDLMSKFQPNAISPTTEDKNKILINETNKNIENNKNKSFKIIENKILEEKKNELIININENINDITTDVHTIIENNEKVLQNKGLDPLEANNNIIETIALNNDKVDNKGLENINIINNIAKAGQDTLSITEKVNDSKTVIENIKINNDKVDNKVLENINIINNISKAGQDTLNLIENENDKKTVLENSIIKNDKVDNKGLENINIINNIAEAGQDTLNLIENENNKKNVLEPIINLDIKAKPKKNKVELTNGAPIDKNQKKLNSFFTPIKSKEEEIREESIEESLTEYSMSSEPSTFEISINDNGEESIKLNFIDSEDEEEKK